MPRSTHTRIHHLKVILGSPVCILDEFSLMLLSFHTFFKKFSWYVDRCQPCYHFVLLQILEISKIEMPKMIMPHPFFSTCCSSKTSMLYNLQLNLEGSIGIHRCFKGQNFLCIQNALSFVFHMNLVTFLKQLANT